MLLGNRVVSYLWMALICFFSAGMTHSVSAAEWRYVNPLDSRNSFVISTGPDRFGIDDVRDKAEYCPSNSDYLCIKAKGFELYIPKRLSPDSKWVRNDSMYTVVSVRSWVLLGKRYDDVYTIDRKTKDEEGTERFLFSKLHGLIAMGGFTDMTYGVYMLLSECGFGASPDCLKTAN